MVVKPEDILDALQKAIRVIEKIISKLNMLEDDMESFEAKRNVAKAIGTTINVVGGGLAVASAFFTGGLSLLVGSAITTAVGTGTNLITDFVDREETKDCVKQIQNYLSEFERVIKELQDLIAKFNEQIEEMMKANDINYPTAFRMFMGMSSNSLEGFKTFALVGFAKMVAEGIKAGSKIVGAGVAAIDLTVKEIKLLQNLFGITIDTAKAGAVIGKSGAAFGKIFTRGVAVVGIFFTALEVIDLIKTFSTDHPTLTAIRDVKRSLREKEKDIQENKDNFEEAQKTAKKIIKESVKKILDEEFGGGYRDSGSHLTQLNYDNFVNQIGTGTMGGFFEIFYLGQMTGRTIELIDGTQERNISMLHGNSKLTFPCFRSRTVSIQLKMTNSGGRNHFNLIRNGQIVEITPHSNYENRCLYDAIAEALNTTTDELLTRFRSFLRNNRAAREAYENGIGEIFEELRGGAVNRRRTSNNGKELKIKKSERKNKGTYTEQTSETTVHQENLDQGTEVSYGVRKTIREMCRESPLIFDAGHIFAYKLGGRGDTIDNVVPMVRSLNRGPYRILEMNILNVLSENRSWYAELSVVVRRRVGEEIPYEFTYHCTFYDANGVEQTLFGFTRTLENSNDARRY